MLIMTMMQPQNRRTEKNTSKMDNEKRKQSSIASEESVKKTKQDDEQHSE
jgi:hypothetical protein